MTIKSILMLLCSLLCLGLTGCSTIQGAGKDIQDVGRAIERAVK
jgi:predicted small secreted protein